jgi:hypothetical protein
LALHAGRGGALLDEAGVVEDEYPAVLAEPLGDVCLQVVADLVGVPAGAVEQALEAVGGGVANVFSQLPGGWPLRGLFLRPTWPSRPRT